MKTYRSNVIVHVDRQTSSDTLHEVESRIRSEPGVFAAKPSTRAKNFLLVDYDPAAVTATSILAKVRGRGINATLIGM